MPRVNSLFTRLLVAQAVTAFGLVAVFTVVFYIERNRTVARLIAERWAPALRGAAGATTPFGDDAALPPLRRASEPPPHTVIGQPRAPRVAEMTQALRARGVDAKAIGLSSVDDNPLVWVAVDTPAGERVWLAFEDELIVPRSGLRLVVALLVGSIVVALVSGVVARRVAKPLETLRRRMQRHGPDAAADPPIGRGAAAEIAAIDAAWREMRERLARIERERELLLAGISHDLRSPLARIRVAAELLPETPELAPRRDAIVRNVGVADRLIGSFLDHVRSGELALDETVDLAAVARTVVAGLDRPPAELRLDAPAGALLPDANRLLVERLLQNLLDNALRHGAPPVCLSVRVGAAAFVIEVEDHGRGIAPERQATLLQAFARGDAGRGTPGTGLGLAVVQRVVARLGGTMGFERRDGAHRVCIELPVRRPAGRYSAPDDRDRGA